jgi:hypothetical protein
VPDNTLVIILLVLTALCLLVAVPVYAMVKATEQGRDRWAAGLAFSIYVPPISLLAASCFLAAGPTDVSTIAPAKSETVGSASDGDQIWTWLSLASVAVFAVLGFVLRK